MSLLDGDTFKHRGYTFKVEFPYDTDMREPWSEADGHGTVSDWRSKDSKAPGERVLCTDHGRARFYDFAGAVKTARKDKWGCKHSKMVDGTFVSGHDTPGTLAACAAESDFQYLKDWCEDRWHYLDVHVTLMKNEDEEDERNIDKWLGGVEDSDNGKHATEVAYELADEIIAHIEVDPPHAHLSEN